MIYSFAAAWRESISRTHRQLPALLKVFAALCVYFLRDFLFLAVLFGIAYFLQSWAMVLVETLAVFEILWIVIKVNGAIGMAVTLVAVDEQGAWKTAGKAYRKSAAFFRNGLNTGVILFFGQVLLVCPCFLLLNNFLFSPYLFVYEDLRGKAAKRRSKELAAGFGMLVLNRTAVLILAGYAFLLLIAILLLIKLFWLAVILIFISGLYLAAIQSNYIRLVYEQVLEMHQPGNAPEIAPQKFKIYTAISILVLIIIYVGIKLSPHFANQLQK